MANSLLIDAADPTPIFEHFRGSHATDLLTSAVSHFDLFSRLARRPMSIAELTADLSLSRRAAVVLVVAMRAMGLLKLNAEGKDELTEVAKNHLVPEGEL